MYSIVKVWYSNSTYISVHTVYNYSTVQYTYYIWHGSVISCGATTMPY